MIEFAQKPGWMSLVLGAALVAVLVWSYRRSAGPRSPAGRAWLLVLRMLVVAIVALCLMDPRRVREVRHPQAGRVALLLDASRSMSVADSGRPRLETAKIWVRDRLRLPSEIELRTFRFDRKLEALASVEAATADGDRTDLGGALEALRAAASDPLLGVVLISDGGENVSSRAAEIAKQFGHDHVPILTLCLGATNEEPDLRIQRVETQPAYTTQGSIRVTAALASPGFAGLQTQLRLLQDGRLVAQQPVTLNGATQRIDFAFAAPRVGFQTMVMEIPADPRERQVDNNRHEFGLNVNDSRLRVIYMEATGQYFGTPEILWLNWALKDQGFDVVPLCHEQYGGVAAGLRDAAAFVDPRNREKVYRVENSRVGYPKTLEELLRFDVVICSDIEQAMFTPEQLRNTVRFVEEFGGGFVMIGGATAFGAGHWQETVWEKIIPVEMSAEKQQWNDWELFQPDIPPESADHPLLRLADTPEENRRIWTERFSPLAGFNYVDRAKPGATALLVHPRLTTRYGPRVILAAQEVGKGRTMAFTSDTTAVWGYEFERYWGEPDPSRRPAFALNQTFKQREVACDDRYYRRFWANAIRWLAANKVAREQTGVQLSIERDEAPAAEPVIVNAKVLDKLGQPIRGAIVTVSLLRDNNGIQSVQAADNENTGVYRASVTPPSPGQFVVLSHARQSDGQQSEARQLLVCKDRDWELGEPRARPQLLAEIALNSGGQALSLTTAAGTILEPLVGNKSQITEYKSEPLWATWVWLSAIVGLLTLEWVARRRLGLGY